MFGLVFHMCRRAVMPRNGAQPCGVRAEPQVACQFLYLLAIMTRCLPTPHSRRTNVWSSWCFLPSSDLMITVRV